MQTPLKAERPAPESRDSVTGARPRVGSALLTTLNRLRLRLWDCRISLISVLLGLCVMIVLAPVQDLFLEVKGIRSIVGFATIVLVFWTIPIHNAAVRAIDGVRRPPVASDQSLAATSRAIDVWLPRLLGVATLFVVFLAARMTAHSLDTMDGVKEIDATVAVLQVMEICVAGAAVMFGVYVVWRRRVLASDSPAFLASLFRAMPTALGIFTFVLLALAVFDPSGFSWRFGREDLLPVLLGGWVPLFAYLAILSQRTGWPITILTIVGLSILSPFADRFHDVRTFRSKAWEAAHATPEARPRQVFVDGAIDAWMEANGCAGAPEKCPPVVLVAAEGGGSRAAFYTGTILGALIDATRADPGRFHDFTRTIFAMSGVSGGALGITLARTALVDAGAGSAPPCRYSDPSWFGYNAADGKDPTRSWRACLQLMASGDYLSPTILGATFRDSLAVLVSAVTGADVADRATLLEQAIEEHYNAVVSGERTACAGEDDDRGLCRPFGYVAETGPGPWLPLLFLNATSVDSGRQIIATDLEIGADSPDPGRCKELYPFSYSVFEILASGTTPNGPRDLSRDCTFPGLADADDIRLSTAAVMSARFPVISPKGNLRNRSATVIEQVIDGAFFDNTGLESLVPLITILRAQGLHPLVIHIANKPWEARRPGAYQVPGRAADRDNPHHVLMNTISRTSWTDVIETISSPLLALNSARSGHIERVEETTMALLADDPLSAYVSPRLYPAPQATKTEEADLCEDDADLSFSLRNLSMSWWLSPLVQRVIDVQLCDPRAGRLLADVLTRLKVHPAPSASR